ncbi:MAG TPA: patatin-like phospholipase family protein [Vicinamibacteria bacterium]|nr:patatin-like phospholipase family protein [Vicinamibacteria bacterium]
MVRALVLATAVATGPATPPAGDAEPARARRTCVALSGGGARGLAHIGVIGALETEGVSIHCVAGTSMGALVGSLYAAGYSPSQMDAVVRSLEWRDVFSGRPERSLVPLSLRVDDVPAVARIAVGGWRPRLPPSRDSDYRTNRLLFRLLADASYRAGGDFDALPRPFRAVATDLETGEPVVLARGSLPRAVRASLSLPVSLVPVPLDGRLLVDGGLVDNLPTGVARRWGADVVVAVDVRSPVLRPRPSDSLMETAAVVVDVLRHARNERFAETADLTIDLRPALAGMRESEYARYPEAQDIGRRVAREAILGARLRLDGDASAAPRAASPGLEGAPVREIIVRGTAKVREQVVLTALGLEEGVPFVMKNALRGMDEIHATRLFESVWLDASPSPEGGASVTVDVQETPRFALEVGGGYDEDRQARAFLRIRNRNLFGRGERSDTTLLASDSEAGLRTTLSVERPFDLPVGVFTRGYFLEEKPRFFSGHEQLGRAEFDRDGLAAGLQRRLGLAGLLRAGLAVDSVRTRARLGVPLPAGSDRRTAVFGEAAWDVLDDGALPTSGSAAFVFAERTLSRLGTSRPYWRSGAELLGAASPHPRLVLRAQARAFVSGGDLPPYEQARVGGPVWMPGFHRDELWGAQALAGSVSAGVAVYGRLRLLARFGAGNVWESRPAMTIADLQGGFGLGLELPTGVGPVALEWGRSGAGTSRVHVSVGFPWDAFAR